MARGLHQVLKAAVASSQARLVYMARLAFDSGVLAWHGGLGDVSYDGTLYHAAGPLAGVSTLQESPGAKPNTLTLTLSGLDDEVVNAVVDEPYLGRQGRVYIALVDESYRIDPEYVALWFVGALDAPSGTYGQTASFSVPLKSRLADWERPRSLKYTDADQQSLYPGDRAFEFIPQMSQKKLIWPRAKYLPDPRD